MDKPRSKMAGGNRFDGSGKIQTQPGTAKWYKQNIPERFNNTKIAVRNTGNFSEHDAEMIAVRVLKWNEGPQPHINDSLIKEEKKLFDRELLKNRYFVLQNDMDPPKGF